MGNEIQDEEYQWPYALAVKNKKLLCEGRVCWTEQVFEQRISGSAKNKERSKTTTKNRSPNTYGICISKFRVTTPLLTKSMHIVTNAEMNPIDVGGSFWKPRTPLWTKHQCGDKDCQRNGAGDLWRRGIFWSYLKVLSPVAESKWDRMMRTDSVQHKSGGPRERRAHKWRWRFP